MFQNGVNWVRHTLPVLIFAISPCFSEAGKAAGWEIYGGYMPLHYEVQGEQISPSNIVFQAGYSLNSQVAILVEKTRTGSSDRFKDSDVDIDVETLSGKLRFSAPLVNNAGIYLDVGYTEIEVSESFFIVKTRQDKFDGFLWGAGVKLDFSKQSLYLGLGYTRYHDKDDITLEGVGIGIGKRF